MALLLVMPACGQGHASDATASSIAEELEMGTNWSQVRRSPRHTSYNPYEHVLSEQTVSQLHVEWQLDMYASSLVLNQGRLYAWSWGGMRLDPEDGSQVWIDRPADAEPTFNSGLVFFGRHGLDSARGAQRTLLEENRWDSVGKRLAYRKRMYVVSTFVDYESAGQVFSSLHSESLPQNPDQEPWTAFIGEGVPVAPIAAANGRVFAVTDTATRAFDADTGSPLWAAYGVAGGSGPAVMNGRVLLVTGSDEVVALDERNGNELWRAPTHRGGSLVVSDGHVMVTGGVPTEPAFVDAFDPATGALQYSRYYGTSAIAFSYDGDLPAGANNLLYIGFAEQGDREQFSFAAVNMNTGDVVHSLKVNGWFSTPIVSDGHVYLSTGTNVYRLGLGPVVSPPVSGSGSSYAPVPSPSGRLVAFASSSNNLQPVESDPTGIFIHDRVTGERHSLQQPGGLDGANLANLSNLSFSADDRYIAYSAHDQSLQRRQVFVHDRATGLARRANVLPGESPATSSDAYLPRLSGDGSAVVYASSNAVYLRDLRTDTIELLSINGKGVQFREAFGQALLSDNARYVVFNVTTDYCCASGPDGAAESVGDIYLRDRSRGRTVRLNTGASWAELQGFSADGNTVLFSAPDASGAYLTLYVWQRATGSSSLLSPAVRLQSLATFDDVYPSWDQVALSANGRFVTFNSETEEWGNRLFVFDRESATLSAVEAPGLQAVLSNNSRASLTDDGRALIFDTAQQLDRRDSNYRLDVYVRDGLRGADHLLSAP